MKAIIIRFWNWLVSLFKRKSKPQMIKAEYPFRNYHHGISDAPASISKFSPPKNNRRRSRGRHLQYVAMPDGRQRFIHHLT
ncbi:hypothetical protein SDC9_17641 [bioreactor metagenome]|uniref:Uncharacterized protein n=1 Tax=bioreactor metagenome TaxID=1076179 RepID=A0A644TY24_9ZZZZ|nr:hypothetical protein [Lentimicrobium sp.]MEA5111720.1 hypothetical protein [Lentimicrobium sp.]